MLRSHSATAPDGRARAFMDGFRRLRAATSPELRHNDPSAAAAAARLLLEQQRVLHEWLPEGLRRRAWVLTSVRRVA